MSFFLEFLELVGTAAFAVSGAMLGLKKRMDLFQKLTYLFEYLLIFLRTNYIPGSFEPLCKFSELSGYTTSPG